MGKHVRHIWAKANQHVKVHRDRSNPNGGNDSKDSDNTLFIVIAVVVLLWIFL